MIEQLPKKFLKKIEITDSCWLWTASKHKKGYGQFKSGVKMVQSHRFSWAYFNGEIPNGMLVCHKCDIPSCVNPSHLFLGTNQENTNDMVEKGRNASGERHGNSKLTYEIVDEIRATYRRGETGEFSLKGLAKKFGTTYSVISGIVNYKSWNSPVMVAIESFDLDWQFSG